MIRNDEIHMRTALWFEDQREYGDAQPNSDEVHLAESTKKDVHEKYVQDYSIEYDDDSYLSYKLFCKFWRTAFPDVKLRALKSVVGKCWTCAWIDDGKKSATSNAESKAFRDLHQLHRGGLYMLERHQYKLRTQLVTRTENADTMMEVAVDAYDQQKCQVPNLGSQQSFPSPITQHITGALRSGGGLTLYRYSLFYCFIYE